MKHVKKFFSLIIERVEKIRNGANIGHVTAPTHFASIHKFIIFKQRYSEINFQNKKIINKKYFWPFLDSESLFSSFPSPIVSMKYL